MISFSRASFAAQASAASRCTGTSVGYEDRTSSRVAPSAQLSRIAVIETRVPFAQSLPPQMAGSGRYGRVDSAAAAM